MELVSRVTELMHLAPLWGFTLPTVPRHTAQCTGPRWAWGPGCDWLTCWLAVWVERRAGGRVWHLCLSGEDVRKVLCSVDTAYTLQ